MIGILARIQYCWINKLKTTGKHAQVSLRRNERPQLLIIKHIHTQN